MSHDILRNAYLDGHNKAHDIVEMAHKKLIEIGASGKGRNDSHDLNTVVHNVVTKVSTMYQHGKCACDCLRAFVLARSSLQCCIP